jgi:NAD(P)-dependent dehydrogenase (short-subunit alcohol dehydrogenase family)
LVALTSSSNEATQVVNERLSDVTEEQLESSFQTNVFAMYYLCQAVEPRMKLGSTIVNTTNVQAYARLRCHQGRDRELHDRAVEPWCKGIRVNCVAPGPIWTPIQPIAKDPKQIEELGAATPLGRAWQPAELAPAYCDARI